MRKGFLSIEKHLSLCLVSKGYFHKIVKKSVNVDTYLKENYNGIKERALAKDSICLMAAKKGGIVRIYFDGGSEQRQK